MRGLGPDRRVSVPRTPFRHSPLDTGIHPVAEEDRTETHFIKIFFIWLSANMNILSCVYRSPSLAMMTYCSCVDSRRARWVPWFSGLAFAIRAWSSCFSTCSALSPQHTCECLVARLSSLAANVLNWAELVRHGARNSVYVSCVRHDIRLGEQSACTH